MRGWRALATDREGNKETFGKAAEPAEWSVLEWSEREVREARSDVRGAAGFF